MLQRGSPNRRPSNLIVTIDGPSGSGKTTVGRLLARALGMKYVDTGSLYRAVAWWMIRHGLDTEDEGALREACRKAAIEVQWDPEGRMRVICEDVDITQQIRDEDTGMVASKISTMEVVRERLNQIQRELAKDRGMVFEGRDAGSVVFPDADFRFFLSADILERARRRYEELSRTNTQVSLEEVREKMVKRDEQDSRRSVAPLIVPKGATFIDTTNLTPQQVVDRILEAMGRVEDRNKGGKSNSDMSLDEEN